MGTDAAVWPPTSIWPITSREVLARRIDRDEHVSADSQSSSRQHRTTHRHHGGATYADARPPLRGWVGVANADARTKCQLPNGSHSAGTLGATPSTQTHPASITRRQVARQSNLPPTDPPSLIDRDDHPDLNRIGVRVTTPGHGPRPERRMLASARLEVGRNELAVPAGLDGNPKPISSRQRTHVVEDVADAIARRAASGVFRVGVDGIDGGGKSTFADEVATALSSRGINVLRSTTDSFHNPRAVRWARGKLSPEDFYLHSHNLDALREVLLDPISANPPRPFRRASFDEPTDSVVDAPTESATDGDVLVLTVRSFTSRAAELLGPGHLRRWRGPSHR